MRPGDTGAPADVHGGKIREAAAAAGVTLEDMLDLSANVNFLGPTPAVSAAARRAVDEISCYPLDPPAPLRRAAAAFLDVAEERVILGNGASELIFLTVAHLRPRRVLVVGPTFTEYARAAGAWGAEVDVLALAEDRDFQLAPSDLDEPQVRERIERADLLFFCDPNNPTGALFDREARDKLLAAAAEAGTPVFVDESFIGFTSAWPEGSATRQRPDGEGLIVLHSFTKILAIPGLRVGALVVSPRTAEVLGPRTPPWNINCVAQAAALTAFAESEVIERTPAATAAAREILVQGLSTVRAVERVLPADANFLCVRLTSATGPDLLRRLRQEHGILLRDLSAFPGLGPRYVRTAVRTEAESRRLVDALLALEGAAALRDPILAGGRP